VLQFWTTLLRSPLFELASVLVRFDHLITAWETPDRRRIVENFGTLRIPLARKSCAQSEAAISIFPPGREGIRGVDAIGLTQGSPCAALAGTRAPRAPVQ
jgi:hypothetical protein